MKNTKTIKWLLTLACLLAALCAFSFAANAKIVDSGTCGIVDEKNGLDGSQVTWTLNDRGKLLISGKGAISDYLYEEYDDKNLSHSTAPWFSKNYPIKIVEICSGVTEIGWSAFRNCSSLESVMIPDSVMFIDQFAFLDCTELEHFEVNKNNPVYNDAGNCIIDSTENSLVVGCKNSVIPTNGSVVEIRSHAFQNCSGLSNVIIPDSVKRICDYAFCGCVSLTDVTIPNSVVDIGRNAFADCWNLISVKIPNDLSRISLSMFEGCKSLKDVEISKNVSTIEANAFSDCESLTSLTIPDSVKNIGNSAFHACKSLTHVSLQGEVTSFGDHIFSDCSSLVSVTIPNSVTSIGDYAFWECESLTSVIIPNSVKNIGDAAFYGCKNLTSVIIPDGIKCIRGLFGWCESLRSVTIPDSVKNIEGGSFYMCTNLTDIFYAGTEEQWKDIIIDDFYNDSLSLATIHFNSIETSIETPDTDLEVFNIHAFSETPRLILDTGSRMKMSFELDCFDFSQPAYLVSDPTFSFVSSDTDVFTVQSISNNGSNTSMYIYGENPGTGVLTVTAYKDGKEKVVSTYEITISGDVVYHVKTMPQNEDYNFISNELYLDGFEFKTDKNGISTASFDVYNRTCVFGSVDLYDKDGNLLYSQSVAPLENSLPTGVWDSLKSAFNVSAFAKDKSYKDENNSKKTSITLHSVPRDGYITITNDVNASVPCAVYNMSYLLTKVVFSLATDWPSADSEPVVESIGQLVLQQLISSSTKALPSAFHSILESFCSEIKYGTQAKNLENTVKWYSIYLEESGVDVGEIIWDTLSGSLAGIAKKTFDNTIYKILGPTGTIMKTGFKLISMGKTAEIITVLQEYRNTGKACIYCSESKNEMLYSNGYYVKDNTLGFENGVSFHQYKIVDGDTYDTVSQSFANENIQVFNLNLYKDGKPIQPKGSVEVAIPVPKGMKALFVKVYRQEPDGSFTKLNRTIENGYIIFTTDHFSVYCITGERDDTQLLFDNETYYVAAGKSLNLYKVLKSYDTDTIELTWTASDSEIISLSPYGFVIGNKNGEVDITVQTSDNQLSAQCHLIIYTFGDVDGDGEITSTDARLALRASVKLKDKDDVAEGSVGYLACDADSDGEVTSADARLILRASVKLEDPVKFGKRA